MQEMENWKVSGRNEKKTLKEERKLRNVLSCYGSEYREEKG